MSKSTSGDGPSLIEVLKTLARDRLTLGREARSRRDSALNAHEEEVAFALYEEVCDHPILDFCRLVEEETGLDRLRVEDMAVRSNTALGLAPLTRTRRPHTPNPTDPELDDLPDAEPKPDLPDLRPHLKRLKKCNVNGTTAIILRRFEELNPGVLGKLGFSRLTVNAAVPAVVDLRPTPPESAGAAPCSERSDAASRAAPLPQTSRPDGLEGGCWLWWQGKRYDIPKGNVYKLLAFLWDRDSAAYDDLQGPVFDDPVCPQTFRSLANKTNAVLKKLGIPWGLATNATARQLTKRSVQSPRT